MVKLAEVVTLYDSNASQIPAMLRKRADAIEAETEQDDRTIASILVEVTESGDLEIYGFGATDDFHCLGVLAMASARLAVGPAE
jgi:hypothetical protein